MKVFKAILSLGAIALLLPFQNTEYKVHAIESETTEKEETPWDGSTISEPMYEKIKLNGVEYMPIYEESEFLGIDKNLNENYILMDDLDFNGNEYPTIAELNCVATETIIKRKNAFTGILEGNGHTISNILISKTNNAAAVVSAGLFGYNKGTIRNLTIKDSNMSVSGHGTGLDLGTVAGRNEGTISLVTVINVNITGTVEYNAFGNTGVYKDFGGIVGDNHGTITNCAFIDGSVTANGYFHKGITSISNKTFESSGGLISGDVKDGAQNTNCFSNGSLSGDYIKEDSNVVVVNSREEAVASINESVGYNAINLDGTITQTSQMEAYNEVVEFSTCDICNQIDQAPVYYNKYLGFSDEIKALFVESGMYERLEYWMHLYSMKYNVESNADSSILKVTNDNNYLIALIAFSVIPFGLMLIYKKRLERNINK